MRAANFIEWPVRIVSWDGMLPLCVAFAPTVVALLLPGKRGAIEITAIVVPVTAFFLRVSAGRRHIASNRCSTSIRVLQGWAFALATLALVFGDCLMILTRLLPAKDLFSPAELWLMVAVSYPLYLMAMAFAMYPGRSDANAVLEGTT